MITTRVTGPINSNDDAYNEIFIYVWIYIWSICVKKKFLLKKHVQSSNPLGTQRVSIALCVCVCHILLCLERIFLSVIFSMKKRKVFFEVNKKSLF